MAKVQISNVEVLDNPSPFFNPFQFQITFDCIENLSDDLEWKILYVGSAESQDYDQTLDSVLVGPIPAGRHKFVFQADPPKHELIPVKDAVGVTVVIITCTYHDQEFVRVGYYVNNEYADAEFRECPPELPDFTKLVRNILDSKPRITRFKINWDDKPSQENIEPTEIHDNMEMKQDPFGSSIEDIPHTSMEAASNSSLKCGLSFNANLSNSNGPLTGLPLENNCSDSMDIPMYAD